jgi:YihY family inner membrane protein
MPDVQRALHRIDEFQQRHRPLAFVYGVIKKFGDDNGGSLGALLTFYGFLSLFPLLLVLVTVLGYVLHDNPTLQQDILNSAVADLPIIGDQIRNNVTSVKGNGIGLVVGLLVTFYGGLGVANSAQDAMNRVWAVPISVRPGFLPRLVRSLALIGILALAIAVTTFLNRLGTGNQDMRSYVRVFAFVIGFFFNIFLFALSFRVLTARKITWRQVLPGAVIAAIGWEVLQAIATLFISHSLQGMSQTYGLFAVVIGLLLWIFLQARVVLYAAEVNIVYVERLWPRSLVQPPLTDADRRAFELYARTQERRRESRATLHFQDLDETA